MIKRYVFLLFTTPALAGNLVGNPGFEPPADNGLAHGWRNNTWGNTQSTFSLDDTDPHSGQTCQKIEAVRGANGAAQFLWPMKVEARKRYHIQLWVRAEGKVPYIGACLRQTPEPYRHYLAGQITPTREWQLLDIAGFVPSSDDNAGLYIWFEPQNTGTVWVDDALVEIIEPTDILGPAPTGNVVPNGSFELDTTRTWEPSGEAKVEATPWPTGLAKNPAAHGKRAMHSRMKAGQLFRLATPCIPFFGNNLPLTLACSARATGGPIRLEILLHSADLIGQPGNLLQLEVQPGRKLRRYAVTDKVPCSYVEAYWLEVIGRAEKDGEVWFDTLSLSPRGEGYEPPAPLEAALSTRAQANVLDPAEPVRLRLELLAVARADWDLRLEVRDYRERLVCEVPVRKTLKPGLTATEVVVPVKPIGAFRADLFARADPGPLASLVFSRIPLPRRVPAAESNIGGHFSTASDWQMQIARRLGYKWTRIHDCSSITHWRTAEPTPGDWRFFDAEVARVKKASLEILGEFLRVPDWATVAEKGSEGYALGVGPYRDVAEFENYVRRVVGHYKDRIRCWEIWNEPYGSGFYGGTAEEYAALAQAAARAARTADPTCTLLAPCTYPMNVDWTERVLASGGLLGVDVFSYHGYGCLTKAPYDHVNRWARKAGRPMPHWNTETGVTADTFYRHLCNKLDNEYSRWIGRTPVEEAVIQSLKLFVLSIAAGSEKYFYYWTNVEEGMAPRMNSMSIYEYDRSLRPHGVVYSVAAWVLDPSVGAGIQMYPGDVTACFLQHGPDAVVVLWTEDTSERVRLPLGKLRRDPQARDTMGNLLPMDGGLLEVERHPVYLVVPETRAEELARRVQRAVRSARRPSLIERLQEKLDEHLEMFPVPGFMGLCHAGKPT